MPLNWQLLNQKLWLCVPLITSGVISFFGNTALAQTTPDQTLGKESSIITPVSPNANRIDGGAVRGSNLFHSFKDFNIKEGQRIDFANPTNVENIFSRVTGGNRSDIFGILGVLGDANLFLLNPNGIIFGRNARLDIRGSFVASTANSFSFADGVEYSATSPQAPPLLKVNFTPGLQFGGKSPSEIVNQGNLIVGKDLTLWGGSITSKGRLGAPEGNLIVEAVGGDVQVGDVKAETAKLSASGNLILSESQLATTGDLSLLAQNTVRVRDSIVNPFVAQAGGKLLVQGNQGIDIFALNHPDSGFASGGNMVLRSANTVGGDAHFWSGGSFRIENLDGYLGDLYSPYDPIIRSQGDVNFDSYTGASLHIFAGGSVTIPGNVTITSKDTPENSIQEKVKLSDNTTVVDIDGSSVPTLDIRAGTTAISPTENIAIAISGFSPSSLALSDEKTSADITIGKVTNEGGIVFLTNQYNPEITLPGGVIKVDEIDTSSTTGNGGRVTIDSGSNIEVSNNINSFSSANNNLAVSSEGGGITLLANGNISTGNLDTSSSANDISISGGNASATSSEGGAITLRANGNISTGNLNTSSSANASSFFGNASATSANGGAITLQANGNISTGNISSSSFALNINSSAINSSGISNLSNFIGNISGNGGDILMEAESLEFGDIDAIGRLGGKIYLNSKGKLNIDNGVIFGITTGGEKEEKGGDINLTASSISLTNFARVASLTLFGKGEGGNINVNAPEKIEIINEKGSSFSENSKSSEELLQTIFSIISGTGLSSSNKTSNLLVELIRERFNGSGFVTSTAAGSSGNAGNLTINTQELIINNKANQQELDGFSIFPVSLAGAATATFPAVDLSQERLPFVLSGSTGNAGKLTVNADKIDISGNDETETFIPTPDRGLASFILDINTGLTATTQGSGKGGEVEVNTRLLTMQNVAGITTGTISEDENAGEGETLKITASEIALSGKAFLVTGTTGSGNAGDLIVETDKLTLKKGAVIGADTVGSGNAGDLNITTNQLSITDGSRISAATDNTGNGATISIKSNLIELAGSVIDDNGTVVPSGIFVNSQDSDKTGKILGQTGNIIVDTEKLIVRDGAVLSSEVLNTSADEFGGNLTVSGNILEVTGGGQLRTTTRGKGDAGNIILDVAEQIILEGNDSGLFADTALGSEGKGGNILTGKSTEQDDGSSLITPQSVNTVAIRNGAKIAVNSQGNGVGGEVNIQAGSLILNNEAEISAETATNTGGDITLKVEDVLLMRNHSNISTTAGTNEQPGDGGNINISSGFVVTVPNENSDITANAFEGSGGKINIASQRIFWMEPRSREELVKLLASSGELDPGELPTNDITAFSQQNPDLNGLISIDLLNTVDPSRGLTPLPTAFIDASELMDESCSVASAKSSSQFVNTGRGGLPQSPNNPLNSDATVRRLATPIKRSRSQSGSPQSSPPLPHNKNPEPIVEAQSWVKLPNGKIRLVAEAPPGTQGNWQATTGCYGR